MLKLGIILTAATVTILVVEFSRAPRAIPSARLARPLFSDLRGVLDVSRHRTGGDLFQPGGLDVVHFDCRCRDFRDLRPFEAARGAAWSAEDGGAVNSAVAD